MNEQKLAAAFNTLSVGLGELAEALTEQPGPSAASPTQAGSPLAATVAGSPVPADTQRIEASPFEDETPTWQPPDRLPTQDEGAEAMCPKHRVLYTNGQYGPYCQQPTDDPAWGKQKGDRLWCKITPKNAAEYLRIRAAA